MTSRAGARLLVGAGMALMLLAPPPAGAREGGATPHAVRRLVERTRGALVRVTSSPRGSAVLIGVRGEILAPEALVRRDRVTVEYDGRTLQARLRERIPDTGLALLALEGEGEYPAAPAGSGTALEPGTVLVAAGFDRSGRLATATGRLRTHDAPERFSTDFTCPPGAGLFDLRGRLVAVRASARSAAVPIDAVRARLGRGGEPSDRPASNGTPPSPSVPSGRRTPGSPP